MSASIRARPTHGCQGLAGRVNVVTDDPPAFDMSTTAGKLADLKNRYHQAVTAPRATALPKQRAKGKLPAPERMAELPDAGSFVKLDELVRPRTHAFGMAASLPYGDSHV